MELVVVAWVGTALEAPMEAVVGAAAAAAAADGGESFDRGVVGSAQ